ASRAPGHDLAVREQPRASLEDVLQGERKIHHGAAHACLPLFTWLVVVNHDTGAAPRKALSISSAVGSRGGSGASQRYTTLPSVPMIRTLRRRTFFMPAALVYSRP